VYGLFLSAESLGLLLMVLVVPKVAKIVGEGRLNDISLALWGLGVGCFAIVSEVWHVLMLGFGFGLLGAGIVPLNSLIQLQVPDELRGRVSASMGAIIMAFVPPAYLIGGFLIDSIKPRLLYAVAGLMVLICGLAVMASRVVREARMDIQPKQEISRSSSL
jgi:hypothetical protein